MIKGTQKLIKIGSSYGITIPAKELKRNGVNSGDSLEFTAKPVQKKISTTDAEIFAAAKKILKKHRSDFENLASR